MTCQFWALPLNAWIMACSVSREIPLCPLARTLILRASSMRVLSGLRGFPTPTCVCNTNQLYLTPPTMCLSNAMKSVKNVSFQQGFYLPSASARGSPAALCGITKQHLMDRKVHEKHHTFSNVLTSAC